MRGLDHRRQVEMARGEARDEGFELAPPLGPRQAAQVLPVDGEQIIEADEGRIVGEHPFRHRLAPEPLLERAEAGGASRRPPLPLPANKHVPDDTPTQRTTPCGETEWK